MDFNDLVEVGEHFYSMTVCPKADSPVVTKILEKFPPVYRYLEEGSYLVAEACKRIEQLCGGIAIPEAFKLSDVDAEAYLGGSIEKIRCLSVEATDCIQRMYDDHSDQRYDTVEVTSQRLKEIAGTIEWISNDLCNRVTNLRVSLIENVMEGVQSSLLQPQPHHTTTAGINHKKLTEKLRQANAQYEAIKRDRVGDAVKHLKSCLNIVPESLIGSKVLKEEMSSSKLRKNKKREVDGLHMAVCNLSQQIDLKLQQQKDDEIHLRMSLLILEAKSLDLENAAKFLEELCIHSYDIGQQHDFFGKLPITACGLSNMSKEEMERFKHCGVKLNAKWVAMQEACTVYVSSSVTKIPLCNDAEKS